MQLTSTQFSATRSSSASTSSSSVQRADGNLDEHRFSQSLSNSDRSYEKHSAADGHVDNMPHSSGDTSSVHHDINTIQNVIEKGQEDNIGNQLADSSVSMEHADLTQQIAYLLQGQQVTNPHVLHQGFAYTGYAGTDTPLTTATLTAMTSDNALYAAGKADSPVHDILAPADNVDRSRSLIEGAAAQLHDGDLSELANILSDKTLSASVVAVSQQGLNAITAKPTPVTAMSTNVDVMSTPSPTLSVDINKPQWGDALIEQLRQRIQMQSDGKLQHAQIRLDPPELGKLEISLRMEGDKLSVQFTAAHPQLREALLAGGDRLRQDFSQSQMNLIDVSVSSGQPQHRNHQKQDPSFASGHSVIRRVGGHSSVPTLSLSHNRTDFDSLV
ncbi:MAG: flagellar hook-length control protein FliK [Plesiomonas sp.]